MFYSRGSVEAGGLICCFSDFIKMSLLFITNISKCNHWWMLLSQICIILSYAVFQQTSSFVLPAVFTSGSWAYEQ
jgi:hypothetical protein